jgi:hypothetical protein
VIGNGAPEFKVIYTESVRGQLKHLSQRAMETGKADLLLTTLTTN